MVISQLSILVYDAFEWVEMIHYKANTRQKTIVNSQKSQFANIGFFEPRLQA